MDKWKDRVALVTGGYSGIGAATSKALVEHGMQVVICARNFDKLKVYASELNQLGPGSCLPIKCDLTNEDNILTMFEMINSKCGGVDVMFNNAGLTHPAPVLSGKTDDWRNMLDVNVLGTAICAREAVKSMKNKGVDDGHIINTSSIAGHKIFQRSNIHFYCLTKAAVNVLTESIRMELAEMNSNIRVSQVSPGVVQTDFLKRAYGLPEEPNPYLRLRPTDVSEVVISILSAAPHAQIHDVQIRPLYQRD